jgi:hypothetical protein
MIYLKFKQLGRFLSLLCVLAGINQAKAANPTLTITNLAAGQLLSNAVFTVQGTAKGGAGVTGVFYSLNATGWSNAVPVNNWTNWSATITLTPGTNSFAAYAVDSNGNRSATNSVNCFYVVLTTLTVLTNGPGGISPAYNNVPLQIGAAYSMTATSSIAGFGLQSWTDGSNNIITNTATLKFLMASNLTFVANIGDIIKPTIAVTSVVTNYGGNPTSLFISGTAADNIAVTNVQYSLNNAAWTNATPGNNWSNWTAQVSVVPGTNTVYLQSVDSSGNLSLTNTVKSFFTAHAILTVRTNGPGKISPAYNGQSLIIGASYSMTATGTKTGYGLVTWTDGSGKYITNSATLKFLMASNLVLNANIGDTTKPTITIKGAYTNADGIGNDYIVYGKAADNIGLSNVFYALNGSPWMPASSTNHWTNWTANVSLLPGANNFSAYALDTTSNASAIATIQVDYNNNAPSGISGMTGIGVFNGSNYMAPLSLAFGKGTFSQYALDTNAVTGVGTYTYSASGATVNMKLKYTGPPSITNALSQNFKLQFYNPRFAYFTNSTTKKTGFFAFTNAPLLSLTNVSGHLIWTVGSQGNGAGTTYKKGTYLEQALGTSATNGGDYTYLAYSGYTSLFKLARTNGTTYVLANFAATNYGSYSEENYTSAGQTNGTDTGTFLVDAQQPGGNAPLTVTNKVIEVISVDGYFDDSLGTDTFSQGTTSSNYDNDVGTFSYFRAATNIGQLNLTITEPPTLAGSNNIANLIFVSSNTGLFTNGDGTVSTFLISTATNLVPASITNNAVLTLNYNSGGVNYFGFDDAGNFYIYNYIFGYQLYGTYDYEVFNPGGAIIHLYYNYLDWLQLNFQTTNSGSFYDYDFDSTTNNLVPASGTFQLQL